MERRSSQRTNVDLKVKLVVGDLDHTGTVQNISDKGLAVKTSPTSTMIDYSQGKRIELMLHLHSNETINLDCRIAWSFKTPRSSIINEKIGSPVPQYSTMGLEIIDPPVKYLEFVKSLSDNS